MKYNELLLGEARNAIAKHPEHRCEIIDLFTLAVSEIEDGGSAEHEYELFMGSIEEIKRGVVNE